MNLHELIFTKNDCYTKPYIIKPKGIMVHSTGANNPNLKRYVGPNDGCLGENVNKNYWNNPGYLCVHAFIGKLANGEIATYHVLPYNYRAYHAGKGYLGSSHSANLNYLSFEICEDNLQDENYFNKVYKEAVEYTAYLCNKFNFNPLEKDVIICHSEGASLGIASNHGDVMHWFPKFNKSMDTFRQDVYEQLKEEDECDMTQEKFNQLMDNYLANLRTLPADSYQVDALHWAMENGLMVGDSNGNQYPQGLIERGDVAVMLYSFYKKYLQNSAYSLSYLDEANLENSDVKNEKNLEGQE